MLKWRSGTSKAYTPASLNEVTTFGFRGEGRILECTSIISVNKLPFDSVGLRSRLVLSRGLFSHEALKRELVCNSEGALVTLMNSLHVRERTGREAKRCTLGPQFDGAGSPREQWYLSGMCSTTSVSPCLPAYMRIYSCS